MASSICTASRVAGTSCLGKLRSRRAMQATIAAAETRRPPLTAAPPAAVQQACGHDLLHPFLIGFRRIFLRWPGSRGPTRAPNSAWRPIP